MIEPNYTTLVRLEEYLSSLGHNTKSLNDEQMCLLLVAQIEQHYHSYIATTERPQPEQFQDLIHKIFSPFVI